MGVSENSGTTKSSILIGFSIINHPFWGTPIFGNTHMVKSWPGQHSMGWEYIHMQIVINSLEKSGKFSTWCSWVNIPYWVESFVRGKIFEIYTCPHMKKLKSYMDPRDGKMYHPNSLWMWPIFHILPIEPLCHLDFWKSTSQNKA